MEKYVLIEELEEIFEQFEIKNVIETRMEKYEPKNNVSWENIREEI